MELSHEPSDTSYHYSRPFKLRPKKNRNRITHYFAAKLSQLRAKRLAPSILTALSLTTSANCLTEEKVDSLSFIYISYDRIRQHLDLGSSGPAAVAVMHSHFAHGWSCMTATTSLNHREHGELYIEGLACPSTV